MNIEVYRTLLENHNWDYLSSDNKTTFDIGKTTHDNLIKISKLSGEFKLEYLRYKEMKQNKIK